MSKPCSSSVATSGRRGRRPGPVQPGARRPLSPEFATSAPHRTSDRDVAQAGAGQGALHPRRRHGVDGADLDAEQEAVRLLFGGGREVLETGPGRVVADHRRQAELARARHLGEGPPAEIHGAGGLAVHQRRARDHEGAAVGRQVLEGAGADRDMAADVADRARLRQQGVLVGRVLEDPGDLAGGAAGREPYHHPDRLLGPSGGRRPARGRDQGGGPSPPPGFTHPRASLGRCPSALRACRAQAATARPRARATVSIVSMSACAAGPGVSARRVTIPAERRQTAPGTSRTATRRGRSSPSSNTAL